MAGSKKGTIGKIILQIALGVALAIAGIWALAGENKDDACEAISKLINGKTGDILAMAFAVVELLAGILLIIEIFVGKVFGKFADILGLIILVVWIIAIVLMDFLNGKLDVSDLKWWYTLATHCVILGALLTVSKD